MLLSEAGDEEGLKKAALTFRNRKENYSAYSKAHDLRVHNDRTQVYGYDRSKSMKTVWAEKKAQSASGGSSAPASSGGKAVTVNVPAPANTGKAYTGEKITKPLDNGGGNGIMNIGRNDILQQAKTRDAKILITDVAVSKANPPVIPHFTQQQNQKFNELHHELLLKSKYENDSNEVAFLFNPNTLKHEFELGDVNSVNIFNNPFALDMFNNSSEKELFLLHNHPTTKMFSYSDIGVLLLHDNIGGITVVSNAGKVDVIYKTDNYDFTKAYGALKEIREKYNHKVLSEEEDAEVVRRFLKICDGCGIKFM